MAYKGLTREEELERKFLAIDYGEPIQHEGDSNGYFNNSKEPLKFLGKKDKPPKSAVIHDPYRSKLEVKKRPHFMGDTDVHKNDPPAGKLPTPKLFRFMTDEEFWASDFYKRLLPKKEKK